MHYKIELGECRWDQGIGAQCSSVVSRVCEGWKADGNHQTQVQRICSSPLQLPVGRPAQNLGIEPKLQGSVQCGDSCIYRALWLRSYECVY
jgi:hypothetical protein